MGLVNQFVSRVIALGNYEEVDRTYLCNRVMALVGEKGADRPTTAEELIDLKDELLSLAVENGFVGELLEEQDCLGASLMDFVTPSPSQVNRQFWSTYDLDPQAAIADFYALSQRNDYIKVAAVAKNIYYQVPTQYGDLEITINLSKPEKDPKAIAAAAKAEASNYPKCLLCMENEGYQGRINHPARANHRIIRLDLGQEQWGFQYSPYAYFNEHAIFLSCDHVPMAISPKTFEQLLDLVEAFPGYFVGSNSDLPISGGSILTHNHYQGGRHQFAMEKAELDRKLVFSGFEEVEAGIVKWPMSVIRLRSQKKTSLLQLAEKILETWRNYSDPTVHILARSKEGEPHHTITPIARKKDSYFELDLVLRDNQTSEEFPDGIYHPHPDVQHIKKENIGLIEVMGLAILPPRLKDELKVVEDFLLGKVDQVADYHQEWANQIKADKEVSPENVTQEVQEAVGHVFSRVLEDAGVYKRDQKGQAAFLRFVQAVGLAEQDTDIS